MTDKEKLEKLKKVADAMYYAAQQLTTDASRLHKAMDEYHKFIINEYHKKESINEDLEKEYDKYIENDGDEPLSKEYFLKLCQHFANWQKQQMLAKAVDGEVTYGKSLAIHAEAKKENKRKLFKLLYDPEDPRAAKFAEGFPEAEPYY